MGGKAVADAPLVFVAIDIAGLLDAIALPGVRMLTAGDEITPDERDRVRVMVVGGPETVPNSLIDRFPSLRLIVAIASGYDGIDVAHIERRGIAIASSIGVNAADVADVAIGNFIALVREIVAGDRLIRSGGWTPNRAAPTRSIGTMRAGIVGMGSIGQAIAARLAAFGCAIGWYGPNPKDVPCPRADSLIELARDSDVLFVAAHLSSQTAGLIDRDVLDALGPRSYLVNVSRGPLVDEAALIEALRDGRLAGAALDVFAIEPTPPALWQDVPNVVLTPHIGGVTHEALAAVMARTRENVRIGLAAAD